MSDDRRQRIMALLRETARPITGTELAGRMGVSRQVIVQDVALLRARGDDVVATPQGYLHSDRLAQVAPRAILACRHDREDTEDELVTLVDHGVKVLDVIVEHPIYGEMRGLLALASREDVRQFVRRLKESEAGLLSAITKGVHLHTVESQTLDMLNRAKEELRSKGYLLSPADEG